MRENFLLYVVFYIEKRCLYVKYVSEDQNEGQNLVLLRIWGILRLKL